MSEVWFYRLALAGTVLTLAIIMSGAWVRLTDAGLGCPDWPGCYGQLTPPSDPQAVAQAEAAFPGAPVDVAKAWREMIHRYAIPLLGLVVLVLAGIALARRHDPLMPLVVPLLLLPLLGLQALLGMLTVTMQLKPIIVVGHLLGGMATLALLGYLAMRTRPRPPELLPGKNRFRNVAIVALVALMCQIALGGWTSANYASMACPDFPMCQGQWLPQADFAGGFDLSRDAGLSTPAELTAIHLAHRAGALLTLLLVGGIALAAALRAPDRGTRLAAIAVLLTLTLQLVLGPLTVLKGLPLALAVAHNGTAALLLLSVVALLVATWRQA